MMILEIIGIIIGIIIIILGLLCICSDITGIPLGFFSILLGGIILLASLPQDIQDSIFQFFNPLF